MKQFNQDAEDLLYILDEVESTVKRNREDIPDNLIKILLDLCYHGKKSLHRMVVEYEHTIMSRDDSSLPVQRL